MSRFRRGEYKFPAEAIAAVRLIRGQALGALLLFFKFSCYLSALRDSVRFDGNWEELGPFILQKLKEDGPRILDPPICHFLCTSTAVESSKKTTRQLPSYSVEKLLPDPEPVPAVVVETQK